MDMTEQTPAGVGFIVDGEEIEMLESDAVIKTYATSSFDGR